MTEQQLWWDPFEEPAWFYDLDHAVRKALRLNGRVPILAASSLARQNPGAFSLTPDFEMIRHGAWGGTGPRDGVPAGPGASAAPVRPDQQPEPARHVPWEPVQQGGRERPVAGEEPRPGRAQLPLQDRDLVA
jgi:hypothetical protein